MAKNKKNNIEKTIDKLSIFRGLDKPKAPPSKVEKDSEGRKEKRGDRGLKHKKKYGKDDE